MDVTDTLRILAGISWLVLITVMFGGYSLLRLLLAGDKLTDFQVQQFRAGHAHAGVLVLGSILYVVLLAWTNYATGGRIAAYIVYFAGALAQSGGFFLHMLTGKPNERSAGTVLTISGAALLALAAVIVAYGLFTA